MGKKALIMPLGRSPAVATEMVRYLEPEGLTDLILLPTKDDFVLAGARLVEAAVKENYPHIRVHMHVLRVSDVMSKEDTVEVMRSIARAICAEKFKFNVDTLYLSISGGRKEASVAATIIGMAFGITKIYHVIHRAVKSYNLTQEKISSDIEKFNEGDIEKRREMYREKRNLIDEVLFPPGDILEFVEIPIIPYLPDYISFLKRVLKSQGIYFEEEYIFPGVLEILKNAGLIEYNEYRVWPTDMGIEIGKMLRCEYERG